MYMTHKLGAAMLWLVLSDVITNMLSLFCKVDTANKSGDSI